MVHMATAELDRGPVIESAVVPFRQNEPRDLFEKRLHQAEHQLIVSATKKMLGTIYATNN